PGAVPWLVSARGEDALRAQAGRLHARLAQQPGVSVADIGLSLATTRAVHSHTAAVIGSGRDELMDALGA
ncbi:hypothetical protein G3M55_80785, partial [Streptomyces sp. SID8455]|nr:hypothetical protein [Streptomyces sp. SID8455]